MSNMRTNIVTMKLNAKHIGGIGARIGFGILVCRGKKEPQSVYTAT
jgi:hypothetical protein